MTIVYFSKPGRKCSARSKELTGGGERDFPAAELVKYVHKRTGIHAMIVKQHPEPKKEEDKNGKEEKKGGGGGEKKEEKKTDEVGSNANIKALQLSESTREKDFNISYSSLFGHPLKYEPGIIGQNLAVQEGRETCNKNMTGKYMLIELGKEAARDCMLRSGLVDSTDGIDTVDLNQRNLKDMVSIRDELVDDVASQHVSSSWQKKPVQIPPDTLDKKELEEANLNAKFISPNSPLAKQHLPTRSRSRSRLSVFRFDEGFGEGTAPQPN
ncbi:hypothetical protein L2E82_40202 [Cichorium intybus]|uniref:Uncharacterized protein n=1 Tax=Cichorium intybus TaxID=13427 RepID=A0ACB9AJN7_CICIN|nr:hypothetical protein L2E82_40202 [Cichorium intybus]